jgi:signal peptidase I
MNVLSSHWKRWLTKIVIGVGVASAVCFTMGVVLMQSGLLRVFKVRTESMAPAIMTGDRVVMETVFSARRLPARGEIIVFRTDGIPELPPNQSYTHRVVGLPGEHVRIDQETLFVNGRPVEITNEAGPIRYTVPEVSSSIVRHLDLIVPDDAFFVLGDNSARSYDSRYWGTVPAQNVLGRVFFCFWPLDRVGGVQ